ncbi:DUF2927 domain-containing protein [Planktotalea lamellibrachiae]|nr:DUF2927 domain-containing protein [Aliiroseovarius lamellibrachiae]
MRGRFSVCATGVFMALVVAGCNGTDPVRRSPTPQPRPAPVAYVPSENSLAMAKYYVSVQRSLLTQGLLRVDGGGADVPFTGMMLARNFMRIAFYNEYSTSGGLYVARESAVHMSRWPNGVRLSMHFGASVPEDIRNKDRGFTARYASRLGRVTGHPISLAQNGNFRVYVLDEDERRAMGPELRRVVPGISSTTVNAVINMPRDTYCVVFTGDSMGSGRLQQAVAVIRAEHPDLMRKACYHEEIAQGLGLSNDSPQARPSIFNDDEEFGLLTTHDEMLLRILYDPRLRPGMSAAEARPIVTQIAAELTGSGAV